MMRGMFLSASLAACLGASAPQDSPRPQDDFYLYVNHDWLKKAVIPPTVPWISPFVVITLKVQDRIKGLIQDATAASSPPGTDRERIGDLYRSYIDQSRIDAAGVTPLVGELNDIATIRSIGDLARAFAHLDRIDADFDPDNSLASVTPIGIYAEPDAHDATRMVPVIDPGGLGLPDRQSYTESSTKAAALRAAYEAHIVRLLTLAGIPDAAKASRNVVALETALASAELSATALHDPAATYHPMTRAELIQRYPVIPWRRFLDASGLAGFDHVVVSQPAHLRRLAELMQTQSLDIWRDYLRWQLLRRYAPYLSAPYVAADFEFYGKRLLGSAEPRSREERGALLVQAAFGEPLGHLYVDRYLDPRAKRDVTRIAERIGEVFGRHIDSASWLDPATKRAARAKLAKLVIKVGYPDRWQDFSSATIRADDLIGNLQRLSAHGYDRRIERIGKPVDRTRWLNVPQATSAYYNRATNELAIPAGYMQAPWYDPNASDATNFGGIGTVIGHEMGHAFDDQGARFDGDGNLTDWWTARDHARFNRRIDRLAAQYDRYEPLPGVHVDGRLTISENVGDLTGLTMAYAALFAAHPGAQANLDEKRQFFESFCRHWRAKYGEPLLRRILSSDGHPPQHYRCDGPLSNFGPFYAAYGVGASDGMYLAKDRRVALW